MATLDVNGFRMHYEDRGSGQPLLLLHGGLGIGDDWRHVFPSDPDGYRVIVPDLRGHGRSTNPAGTFTVRQCAQDVLALLERLGISQARAIGLSLGAKTLLHIATAQPARIEAMVLVSATPVLFRSRCVRQPRSSHAKPVTRCPEPNASRCAHDTSTATIKSVSCTDMVRSFATSDDDMAFTASLLGTITARTLVVHGDRDPLYPVEMALELFRGIPASALWVVPNGGHGPIFGAMAQPFATRALAHLAS